MKKIILDTDIGNDCDDAGAMAVLHALADLGKAEILAVTHSVPLKNNSGVGCIDAINRYYGRADIPVGASKSFAVSTDSYIGVYSGVIASEFPNAYSNGEECPDSIRVMRQVLSDARENSVTLISIGWLTNLSGLLSSLPDDISPLSGAELIRQKIEKTVIMGGCFDGSVITHGAAMCAIEGEWNIIQDIPASIHVASDWRGAIVFSPFELGAAMKTGSRLQSETKPENPIRRSYEVHDSFDGRYAWDSVTVLYAVCPEAGYFKLTPNGKVHIDDKGITTLIPGDNEFPHAVLLEKMPLEQVADILDNLTYREPAIK